MNTNQVAANHENIVRVKNGWLMLMLIVGVLFADVSLWRSSRELDLLHGGFQLFAWVLIPVLVFLLTGFFSLQPNEARILRAFRRI